MPDDAKTVRDPSRNILQRLNAVMQDISYIQKEKKAAMRYSIVSHDAVTAKVRPEMVKQGIVYWPVDFEVVQIGNRTQLTCKVIFASIDNPQDRIAVASMGYGIDDQDKGPGKAISYAVKYALLKALGMESGDDPDYEQDSQHKPATGDPAMLAIDDFRADTVEAKTMDELRAVATKHKASMDHALALYPAFVQQAKTEWQKKAAKLKGTDSKTQADAAAQ